jgi:HD-GYP domain-containing protein (c-di-GMP phosphodiesterase class II)
MLAMSIGTVLGLARQELIELALGCLIHDAGMLHVNPAYVNSQKPLGRSEFLEITKHPALTFDLVRQLPDVPAGARMVAYQMHERCNGTGYPRQRSANQIHPLAKIAAVADVFVALVSPRPHREGMLPYHAIEKVLQMASAGELDRDAVRGLIKTVSLFPIGSFVETSDGRIGRVLRANRELYARPTLELWYPSEPGRIEAVDLAHNDRLQIVRPLNGTKKAELHVPSLVTHKAVTRQNTELTEPELARAIDFWE